MFPYLCFDGWKFSNKKYLFILIGGLKKLKYEKNWEQLAADTIDQGFTKIEV